MGIVTAEIELVNAGDMEMARRKMIGEEEIKRMSVSMLVDTGAYNLCINETIQEQLDLPFIEKRKAILANGHIAEYDIVGPVVVKLKTGGQYAMRWCSRVTMNRCSAPYRWKIWMSLLIRSGRNSS
ncbi:MAG: hypothetical protein QM802_18470 [Agriterribacter sp.]